MKKKKYQWIATSGEGLVRYLAANILPHGYRFYFAGEIKPTTDLNRFDRVMNEKFGYNISRSQRYRRKSARGPDGSLLGLANVHYLRHERFYVLIATSGGHPFFNHHMDVARDRNGRVTAKRKYFRDIHRDPLFFRGWSEQAGREFCYSIRTVASGGYKAKRLWKDADVPEFDGRSRVRVTIARDAFTTLQAEFTARAQSRLWSAEALEAAVWGLPYLPYRPVREQLWGLVRRMNAARQQRGFRDRLDPRRCIRYEIPAIKAFEPVGKDRSLACGA
ncbi:hypothetical protein OAS39_03775 [Pirellulales bacterium]|nr:hypothetical protein [Pirellulales bacterium]